MASEWAIVAAGIGGATVPPIVEWVRDRGRRNAEKDVREEKARADAAAAKRKLILDVIDICTLRRESDLTSASNKEISRMEADRRAVMLRLALEGEPEVSHHARTYLRTTRPNIDEWLDELVVMVANLEPLPPAD